MVQHPFDANVPRRGRRYGSETATGFEFADEASPLADQPSGEPLVNHLLKPLVSHGEKLCRVVEHQMLAAVDNSSRHPSSKAVHPLQQRRGEPHLATKRTAADRSGLGDRAATLRLGREPQRRVRTDRRSGGVSPEQGTEEWTSAERRLALSGGVDEPRLLRRVVRLRRRRGSAGLVNWLASLSEGVTGFGATIISEKSRFGLD
jgi:hypothetical protein